MAASHTSGYVVPNPRVPSVLGTLNVLFGALLALVSVGFMTWEVLGPSLWDWMGTEVRKANVQERAEREAKISVLKTQEAAEKSVEKKAELQTEREALEAENDDTDLNIFGVGRRKTFWEHAFFWASETTGLVLNGLMIAAGVGLLALRPWGRSLALWVAGLKLGRLFAIAALTLMVLIPHQVAATRASFLRSAAKNSAYSDPGGAAESAKMMAQATAISSSLSASASFLFGVIYPALTLWLLNKRSVRAALVTPYVPPGVRSEGDRATQADD